MKPARLTPAGWRAAQTPDAGRGRPSKDTAEVIWQMLTTSDPALRIESLLPPESLCRRLTKDEQAKASLTAKRVLVVVMAAVVAAGRRQDPVTFSLALDAVALRWSETYRTAKVARLVRQMTRETARATVREVMEVGIRLDDTWRLAVSGPWSCEGPSRGLQKQQRPLNPLYYTSRVALGPYDVALYPDAVKAFEARVLDDDAYHEVEPPNSRRVIFAGTELPSREPRQDVVAEWTFNVVPSGLGSTRTFTILEATQLQLNVTAVEKDLADAEEARKRTLTALREHSITPEKRAKRPRWDGTSGRSIRERQIASAFPDSPPCQRLLERLTRQYDRAASTVGLLQSVVAQVTRYRAKNPGAPVRIQTRMFRASHGRFYPRSFWPTEASTRETPWGDATRPRWFKDRDGRDLVEYDISASQSQIMGAFLGLSHLEAAACATTPRFKEYLAAHAWKMVADKVATPTQSRCTDMLVQFHDAPDVPAYAEPQEVDGRIGYDPRLVAMVKQAWMTFTYGSPPNEVIKTLRDDPERYGPGFGGEYIRTITRGPRKGEHRVDGGARSLMAFFRALPWFAQIKEYLVTCVRIAETVGDYAGFVITDPLDRRPFRWNPVAVKPLDEVKSVGGNRVLLDVPCVVGKKQNEPLRIGHKMETADGYSWIEYDEIKPRAKYQPAFSPATPNAGDDYPIDRGQLSRQLAPQVIHLLDSYFAALVSQGLHRQGVRDMVVVHDAFCVAEEHAPVLLSAIHDASETWFRGLGPVYKVSWPRSRVAFPRFRCFMAPVSGGRTAATERPFRNSSPCRRSPPRAPPLKIRA
jgi:hypothetical protein